MNQSIRSGLIGGLILVVSAAGAMEASYRDAALSVDQRVEDLLRRMTLEEKVAQMRIFRVGRQIDLNDAGELVLTDDVKQRLAFGIAGIKYPGSHLDSVESAAMNNQLQRYIIEHNRLGIPALFATEAYHGVNARDCTQFCRPITTASSWDTNLVKKVWDVIGREARLRGMHMAHSPEADILRDPRFGRMSEGFGEDTCLNAEMVVAAVTGMQGDDAGLTAGTHVGAVVKHFAGYGQVQGGLNFASIEISPRVLLDEVFPPFQAAIQRGHALGLMVSHGDINGVASHANEELLTGVLRDQWGFQGYVVSDANDIERLHTFMKVAETPEDAARMALKAGVDIDLYSDNAYALLPEMVQADPSLLPCIDRSVRRVLRTKFILGLFDQPYTDESKAKTEVRSEASLTLALQADLESIILLKNENDALPLTGRKYKEIAMLGPLVKKHTLSVFENVLGDHYRFRAEKGFGLTNRDSNAPELKPTNPAVLDEMVDMARTSDLVVLFLGGDAYTSKEAYFMEGNFGDRDSIDPVGDQDELVRRVKALGKPVVVVLQHRRTLSINTIAEQADAILDCWELGEFGDKAIAKIIAGEVSPSGKLPVTVPRSIGQLPFHYSRKAINFRKRYLFTDSSPLFCFGHGLSYTTFEYGPLKLSGNELRAGGERTVCVDVTNTGARAGKEVVQLYIKDPVGSVVRPEKELKAFQKVELQPGEMQTVSFVITPEQLAFTGKDMLTDAEVGEYIVMVGSSCMDTQAATLEFK